MSEEGANTTANGGGDGDIVGKAAARTTKHLRNVSDGLTGALDRATKQVKKQTGVGVKTKKSKVSAQISEHDDGGGDAAAATGPLPSSSAAAQDAPAAPASPVPPDETIRNMDLFVNEVIKNVSVKEYYDKIWSETTGEFYGPWLAHNNKMKILVSDWEEGDESRGYVGPLDGETYGRKRVITFVTKRSGIGPSTAEVTQTHLCRIEGSDRCVVSITINMKVPFGDSFSVSVRWVASRSGANDLSIQCGMRIVFLKSCIVEGKIRSNTTVETKKGQGNLFLSIRERLEPAKSAATLVEEIIPKEPAEAATTAERAVAYAAESPVKGESCWTDICSIFGKGKQTDAVTSPPPPAEVEDIILSICSAHHKLGKVHEKILSGCCGDVSAIRSELKKINSSLSKIADE